MERIKFIDLFYGFLRFRRLLITFCPPGNLRRAIDQHVAVHPHVSVDQYVDPPLRVPDSRFALGISPAGVERSQDFVLCGVEVHRL